MGSLSGGVMNFNLNGGVVCLVSLCGIVIIRLVVLMMYGIVMKCGIEKCVDCVIFVLLSSGLIVL